MNGIGFNKQWLIIVLGVSLFGVAPLTSALTASAMHSTLAGQDSTDGVSSTLEAIDNATVTGGSDTVFAEDLDSSTDADADVDTDDDLYTNGDQSQASGEIDKD